MAKTIIQTIGPLYGEVVNGTVFGRPNGSVYVPSVNTISVTVPVNFEYVRLFHFDYGYRYIVCNSEGGIANLYKVVAESQDIQSHIQIELQDSNGDTVGTARAFSAGIFNTSAALIGDADDDGEPAIVANDTYYIVATLVSASGVPVATDKVAVTGVVAA